MIEQFFYVLDLDLGYLYDPVLPVVLTRHIKSEPRLPPPLFRLGPGTITGRALAEFDIYAHK